MKIHATFSHPIINRNHQPRCQRTQESQPISTTLRSSRNLAQVTVAIDQVKRFSDAPPIYQLYQLADYALRALQDSSERPGSYIDAMRMGFDWTLDRMIRTPLKIDEVYRNAIAFTEFTLDLMCDVLAHIQTGRFDLRRFKKKYSNSKTRDHAKRILRETQEIHFDKNFGFARIKEMAESGRAFFEENPDLLPILVNTLVTLQERLEVIPAIYYPKLSRLVLDPDLWRNPRLAEENMRQVHTANLGLAKTLTTLHWDLWRSFGKAGASPERIASSTFVRTLNQEFESRARNDPAVRFSTGEFDLHANRQHLHFFLTDLGLILPRTQSGSVEIHLSDEGSDLVVFASPINPQPIDELFVPPLCPARQAPNPFALLRFIAKLEGSWSYPRPNQLKIVLKRQIST